MTRQIRSRAPRPRDPYGIGPIGSAVGPIASVAGLLLIAVVTINLFNYELPFSNAGGNGGNGNGGVPGPGLTPAPSGVIVIPEEATFLGSIVYAKGGTSGSRTTRARSS